MKEVISIDSVEYSNYSKYSCGIDKRTITYYLTLKNRIANDTIVLDTGTRLVELVVTNSQKRSHDWQYTLEYVHKDFEILSLRELTERNVDITHFKKGALKELGGKLIDCLSVSSNTSHVYYLNRKKVFNLYSLEFEEEVPFVPLTAPQ